MWLCFILQWTWKGYVSPLLYPICLIHYCRIVTLLKYSRNTSRYRSGQQDTWHFSGWWAPSISKKYSTGFDTCSPLSHHMKFSTESREEHSKWIESTRETIWVWTKSECEMVPSNDALMLHWKWYCWVIHIWREANRGQQVFKPLAGNGWEIVNSEIQVVWDSQENIEDVRSSVEQLTGCQCVTDCDTNRYGCRKNGKLYSAGCNCKICQNTSAALPTNTSIQKYKTNEHCCN